MKDTEIRKLEMLRRVRDFGTAHASSFPAASLAAQKFAAVGTVVEEVEAHGTTQSTGKGAAHAGASAKRAARADVREKMAAIRDTALALEDLTPGVSGNFRIPRTNGDQALITGARLRRGGDAAQERFFTARDACDLSRRPDGCSRVV